MTYTNFINEVKMTCCSMYHRRTDSELNNMFLSAQRVIQHRIGKRLEKYPLHADRIYPQEHLDKYAEIYAKAAVVLQECFEEAEELEKNYAEEVRLKDELEDLRLREDLRLEGQG